MPYTVTAYPHGTFSWADVQSQDIDKTKEFMTKLFGWSSQDLPTEEGRPDYTMFYLDGHEVAGGSQSFMPTLPSFWVSYITVRDVDEIEKKAYQSGATITMSAMDVLESGRMCSIVDPTGAAVSFWEPRKHIGAHVVNKVGAMCWNELYTPDLEKSKKFYADVLGWTYETDQQNYINIKNNGRRNGGILEIQPEWKGMRSQWMVYFTVEFADEMIEAAQKLGGTCPMGPKDIGIGTIAMIADPSGAHFMVIEMHQEPDEWIESVS